VTDVALDDQLVADTMRSMGLDEKSKAVEAALRLQLQLESQAKAVQELWGSFEWQGNLEESRSSRDFLLNDDHRR
jgi:Arc/MetJ family transcription regulator